MWSQQQQDWGFCSTARYQCQYAKPLLHAPPQSFRQGAGEEHGVYGILDTPLPPSPHHAANRSTSATDTGGCDSVKAVAPAAAPGTAARAADRRWPLHPALSCPRGR